MMIPYQMSKLIDVNDISNFIFVTGTQGRCQSLVWAGNILYLARSNGAWIMNRPCLR